VTRAKLFKEAGRFFWSTGRRNYKTIAEYDSAQQELNTSQRDGWFMRTMEKKQIELNGKYGGNPGLAIQEISAALLHKLPYLLFISLPLFALFLKLLYVRRKQFYYADHAIFTIHHYIFSFILLLFIFLLGGIRENFGLQWLVVIEICLFIAWPVYLYIAMLNFYQQKWFKTFVKFFLLNILGFFSLLLLFIVFFFLSIFQL
jgi:hypothetical protein